MWFWQFLFWPDVKQQKQIWCLKGKKVKKHKSKEEGKKERVDSSGEEPQEWWENATYFQKS